MADLTVDFIVLRASETSMASLRSEFDGIEDRHDSTRDIWGHNSVRDAMHEFANNMHHHRKELSQKMQETGEKITGTIEAFEDIDAKLKAELEKNTTDTMPEAG